MLNNLGQTCHDYVNYGIALVKYDNVYCSKCGTAYADVVMAEDHNDDC